LEARGAKGAKGVFLQQTGFQAARLFRPIHFKEPGQKTIVFKFLFAFVDRGVGGPVLVFLALIN